MCNLILLGCCAYIQYETMTRESHFTKNTTEMIQDKHTEIFSFVVQGHRNNNSKILNHTENFSFTYFFCSEGFERYSRFLVCFSVRYDQLDQGRNRL